MFENLDPRLILAGIAGVAWLVRVEAKVLYLEKDLLKHEAKEKEKEKVFWAKIESMEKSIGQVLETVIRMEEKIKFIQRNN